MADPRILPPITQPLTFGGKTINGKVLLDSNGVGRWYYPGDLPEDGRPIGGDYSTLISKQRPDGSWGPWSPTTDKSIPNLSSRSGISVAAINSSLWKTPTIQNTLNQTRTNGLGGPAAAGKIDPKIPGATNVDGTVGAGASDITTQSNLKSQAVAIYRDTYGNFRYPLSIDNTTQDCIRFSMHRYVPKQFNATLLGKDTFDTKGNLFEEPTLTDKDKKILGTVTLPIQSPASDTNTVVWGDNSMDAVNANAAALALSLITGGESGGGVDPSKGAEKINQVAGQLGTLVATKFAEQAATGQSGSLYTRLTGAIINPNMELLFNSPALRSFSFNFKLSAREAAEAVEIRKIIRFFKQGMSVKKAESNLFLVSPNVFEIHYLYRGGKDPVDHPWMNRFKTCALQSCSVNYTPEGNYATYDGGSMTSYEISLNFGELTPIYDSDYDAMDKNLTEIGY